LRRCPEPAPHTSLRFFGDVNAATRIRAALLHAALGCSPLQLER
jgi:hypothetical protein